VIFLTGEVYNHDKVYMVLIKNSEDGGYIIKCPELDCITQGDDIEEAISMIQDRIEEHLAVLSCR